MKSKFLVSVPFTGLGLYGGFRGSRWLRNRIKVFETFVVPSLLNQTDQDFILWVCWREEERRNKDVLNLHERLLRRFDKVIFTYHGIPFWDDKYPDEVARDRLFETLRFSLPDLLDVTADADEIHWLLQPSDDLYHKLTVESVKAAFADKKTQAVSYTEGYICNYSTLEVKEYTPKTNPPFFAIKFPRTAFFDAGKHINYTGPYKSHEYIGEKLKLAYFEGRGFMVGTHGENISTHFNHPYGGAEVGGKILFDFGIANAPPLVLPVSTRKWLMRQLPHQWQRKLRYWFGELIYSRVYNWIRS